MPTPAHAKNAARTVPILAHVRDELARDGDEQETLDKAIDAVQTYRQGLDHDAEVPDYQVDKLDWRILTVAATNLDGFTERVASNEVAFQLTMGRQILDEHIAERREGDR